MSHRRNQKYNHDDIYGSKSKQTVDDTQGNPLNDARIIQYKREIKQLKEKIELQTELNRQLERDKNELSSKLESYKLKCSDLQKNLDDKDQHLNEVLMGITAQHSKPIQVQKSKKKKGWFGFGTPRSSSKPKLGSPSLASTPQPYGSSNMFSTPQPPPLSSRSPLQSLQHNGGSASTNNVFSTGSAVGGTVVINSSSSSTVITNGSPSNIEIHDDYIGSPLNSNTNATTQQTIPCMTAPIGSLPTTRSRRNNTIDITSPGVDTATPQWGQYEIGTSTLVGMERSEMEFKIKNSSSNKLRNYIRDLFDQYYILDKEKNQLFQEYVKATHNYKWTEKEALNADKEAKNAKQKEKSAKNHIISLEKSLMKERKKIDKYKVSFEDFKQNAIKKRKELLVNEKKLKDIITMKDEFIQRACYKLIVYKDRLSQFEVPVFQEYVILLAPDIQQLLRYDGEGMNGPGAASGNLSALHEDMVQKQTPGGPGFVNEDVNSAGGTVTSVTSVRSESLRSDGKKGSIGRRKSSSRKSSAASQPNHDGDAQDGNSSEMVMDGDINDVEMKTKKKQRKKKKHKKDKRVKSFESGHDDGKENEHKADEINIPITAKSKNKKKKKNLSKSRKSSMVIPESLSNLSKKIEQNKKGSKKKKKGKDKKKIAEKMEEEDDYLDMDLDEMVSSSSSDTDDTYMLLSDSEHREKVMAGGDIEYRLDANGKYIEDGITNNLADYVELKLVKYPGTGELFMVITKFDEKKDAMEVFRTDFAKCLDIQKNEIQEDFTIYFEYVTLIFRADDYEKARRILIDLRVFFEQHCTNIQPELPPAPETHVSDQMKLFFGDDLDDF